MIPQGFLADIVPQTMAVLGHDILEVLALPLLWAAFEDAVTVNGTECRLVPTAMRNKIMHKWLSLGGEDSNPIEKILFSVQQLGNELMLFPLSMGRAARDEGEGGAASVAGFMGNVVAGGVSHWMPCIPNFFLCNNKWKISEWRSPQILLSLVAI
jgi:hypothetical protein